MTDPRATLSTVIGQPLPPALATLSDDQLTSLVRSIEAAQQNQRAALTKAVDDGLGIVPRVLRGAVRKALFG